MGSLLRKNSQVVVPEDGFVQQPTEQEEDEVVEVEDPTGNSDGVEVDRQAESFKVNNGEATTCGSVGFGLTTVSLEIAFSDSGDAQGSSSASCSSSDNLSSLGFTINSVYSSSATASSPDNPSYNDFSNNFGIISDSASNKSSSDSSAMHDYDDDDDMSGRSDNSSGDHSSRS